MDNNDDYYDDGNSPSTFRKRSRRQAPSGDEVATSTTSPDEKRMKTSNASTGDAVAAVATTIASTTSVSPVNVPTVSTSSVSYLEVKNIKDNDVRRDEITSPPHASHGQQPQPPSPVATSPLRRRHASSSPSSTNNNNNNRSRDTANTDGTNEADNMTAEGEREAITVRTKSSKGTYCFTVASLLLIGLLILGQLITLALWQNTTGRAALQKQLATERVARELSTGYNYQIRILKEQLQQAQQEARLFKAHVTQLQTTAKEKAAKHDEELETSQQQIRLRELQIREAESKLEQAQMELDAVTARRVEPLRVQLDQSAEMVQQRERELEDLWNRARDIEKNRDEWQTLAVALEHEHLPHLQEELQRTQETTAAMKQKAERDAIEREQLQNLISQLQHEKEALVVQLQQSQRRIVDQDQ